MSPAFESSSLLLYMAAFHLINSILTIKNVIMIERKTLRWIRSSFNFSFLSGATAPLHSYVCMSVCVSLCVPHWPRFVTVAPHTGCDFYPYVYMCREPFMDNLGYSCADREQQPTAWTEHQGHDDDPGWIRNITVSTTRQPRAQTPRVMYLVVEVVLGCFT